MSAISTCTRLSRFLTAEEDLEWGESELFRATRQTVGTDEDRRTFQTHLCC